MGKVAALEKVSSSRVRSSYGALASLLRRHIQPAQEAEIAAALGVSERTIQAWRYGEAEPRGVMLLKLFRLLGGRFRNDCLAEFGCNEVTLADMQAAAMTLALLLEREAA